MQSMVRILSDMVIVTVFLALVAINALWFVQSKRRNRRKARMNASMRAWINHQQHGWTEADDK